MVQIEEILPENAVKEITHGHPDFQLILVSESDANVSTKFGDRHMRVEGVEDAELRERLAGFVLRYLENPNKAEEDRRKREEYEKLPPREKMNAFVERMKGHYPDFDYEWVGLDEGNTKVEYIDNGLIIRGVEDEGAREEIGHAIYRLQKELDAVSRQEN